ncbi:MAG TPA: hypothetical protein RMH85_30225 [Polyangiaceae bacterium LLY-WYZ-15_(1-7)]|nr:hypothetical protein [Myxococcales bacterium]MAT29284.1 hypothetical protein [Sandaracinus sp.]HJK89401.1 hypothetical protein [Polyangiaceae bacterium LLY-WYZ-15_(1-7)]HJL05465.1 hypothetical protein [Polyangiaceae bacterium LLY-WYZ-15_(1-7)]HJL12798.1 hypothetical protein [Polyangiaceae bacterium LLY-WYZ-15_(1-7)]
MSTAVSVYRVPLDYLPKLVDRLDEVSEKLEKRFGDLVAQRDDRFADEIAEGCPTASEAMRLVLTGEPVDERWGFQLVYGLELVCMVWGWQERNDAFSPTSWEHLEHLRATLGELMEGEPLGELLTRGSPLPLQAPLPDLPAVGFLRNEEIAATLERWPDLARADLPSEDRRAFQQLELWLRNATGTYPRDQVAFTY